MKKVFVPSILVLVILGTGTSFSQVQRGTAKPKLTPTPECAEKIAEQQAQIEELKKELKGLQDKKSTNVKSPAAIGNLEIEAGLLFKTGDTKPVARATFRLLKANPETFVRTPQTYEAFLSGDTGYLAQSYPYEKFTPTVVMLWYGGKYREVFTNAVNRVLDEQTVVTMTTGFDGKGTFNDVPTGEYFLFGKYRWGDSSGNSATWNLPISIKPGINRVVLDNQNTSY